MKTYRRPPPIVTGYVIDDVHKFWIVVPEESTNLITNPSLETASTGWTLAGSASIARSTTQQRRGAYSLAVTMTAATGDGAYYGTVSLTSGTTYTYSVDVYAPAGMPLKAYFATTGGVQVGGVKQFKGIGRWQRVSITYTETSSTTRRLYVTKDASTKTGTVYLDGAQLEAKSYPTTYIDGDQRGLVPNQFPVAFAWTGTPHASTSTRSGQTRAGGRLIPLSRYFTLLAIAGLGIAPLNIVATPYAQLDGAQYERSQKPQRGFTLGGRFDGVTPRHLASQKSELQSILDRDLVGLDQPLILRYQHQRCDEPAGEEIDIPCVYTGGLEDNITGHHSEAATITFTTYIPAITLAGDAGASLAVQTSVSNADYFITRSSAGTWQILGASGANGVIRAIAVAPNGDVYVGGDFTNMGGSGADYIARWDGSAWNTVGGATALNNSVYALAFGPDGTLYVGGSFTNAGGNASADGIATWNGSAWGNLSTGTAGQILCLAVTPTGGLYVGGGFTSIGGSTADNLAFWNGSAWANLASDTAINNNVYALVVDAAGNLYAAGDFTDAGGVANADRIAKWSGTIWSALGTGSAASVRTLAIGPDGGVYAAGNFTAIGGVTAAHIAKWNGTSWAPLGSGLTTDVYTLAFIGDQLYAGGVIATAGGISVPDGLAIWSGGAWVYTDVDLPSSATVYTIAVGPDNRLYLGYDQSGTATVASTTTITNPGTAKSYPTIVIKGPSSGTARIFRIANAITGRAIYLNYTINAGETATLVFQPDNLSFTSDFQGNIAGTILPGSNTADFFLQPGSNTIVFLSASTTVTATFHHQPAYASLNDTVW